MNSCLRRIGARINREFEEKIFGIIKRFFGTKQWGNSQKQLELF